jgi:lipopolysaccharide export system permease protein
MQLNRKYELVVTRAAGISAWQFLAPLIIANLLIGVLSITVLNTLAASAMQKAEDIVVESNLGSRQPTNAAPWLRQRTAEGRHCSGRPGQLRRRHQTLRRHLFPVRPGPADQGTAGGRERASGDGVWELTKVKRIRGSQPVEELESTTVPTSLKAEFVGESLTSPETVPFFELREKIAAAKSFGLPATSYETQFHRLLALPALLAAMTVIAAMVSLKFVRFGQSLTVILGGILAGFVLYVVSELIQAFANAGTIPPVVAAWLPVLVASALGTTVLLHKEDG